MSREIPVMKINSNYRDAEDEPVWIELSEIVKTFSSGRVNSKTITVIETASGIYRPIAHPEEVANLLNIEEEDNFIVVDRGSVVNMNYADGIDDEFKMVILKDKYGKIIKACISSVQFRFVKEFISKFIKGRNRVNE